MKVRSAGDERRNFHLFREGDLWLELEIMGTTVWWLTEQRATGPDLSTFHRRQILNGEMSRIDHADLTSLHDDPFAWILQQQL